MGKKKHQLLVFRDLVVSRLQIRESGVVFSLSRVLHTLRNLTMC